MPSTADRTMHPKLNGLTNEESSRDEADAEYYVLGGNHLGASVARRLQAAGHVVRFVDETHSGELPGRRGNPQDVRLLEAAGLSEASTVIVVTPHDSRNLLIAQLVRTHFDVSEVLVLVNRPERHELAVDIGHRTVCATTALADEIIGGLDAANTDTRSPS